MIEPTDFGGYTMRNHGCNRSVAKTLASQFRHETNAMEHGFNPCLAGQRFIGKIFNQRVKNVKGILRTFLYSTVALVLAACGGDSGSSSSGGGGAGSFAGSYSGIASLTVSGGGASERTAGSLEFLVRSDGSVVSDPGTDFSGHGTVQGNRLILNLAASSFNEPGLSCLGSFRIEGTISGNRITGTISGSSITCNGVPFTVTGTFNVTRVSQSRRAWDGQALQAVGSILGQSVQ